MAKKNEEQLETPVEETVEAAEETAAEAPQADSWEEKYNCSNPYALLKETILSVWSIQMG